MSIVFHITFSILFTAVIYLFFLLETLPSAVKTKPLLELLPIIYQSLGGILIAGFALSATLIYPKLKEQINNLKAKKQKVSVKFDSEPNEAEGIIIRTNSDKNNVSITVSYDNHKKTFEYPPSNIHTKLEEGDLINVYYNPKNPKEAYLDLYSTQESPNASSPTSIRASFKLLEVNPKFENENNLYEIIGELHQVGKSSQKASILHILDSNQVRLLIPGSIVPCEINGEGDNLSISMSV